VIPDIGVNVQTVFRYRVLSHPISGPQSPDIGVNDYDQTVTAAAWIPQGFTKVMMRCSSS
jgi:hypothetical protein